MATLVETRVETPGKILAVLRENPSASLAKVASTIGRSPNEHDWVRVPGLLSPGFNWPVQSAAATRRPIFTREQSELRGSLAILATPIR